MNDERERTVAADVRRRVIADCAALLPLARSACGAMDEEDETEFLRLFCGESQKKTLRRLGRLIDDLRLCRTAADLPGPEQTIRNWDQNGCPFAPNYPGRFNAIIFYQWAQTFRSLQNFKREAKKRAVLMNKPA